MSEEKLSKNIVSDYELKWDGDTFSLYTPIYPGGRMLDSKEVEAEFLALCGLAKSRLDACKRLEQERDGLQAEVKLVTQICQDNICKLAEVSGDRDALKSQLAEAKKDIEIVMLMADGTDNLCLVGKKKWEELSARLSLMQNLLQEMKDNDDVMNWTATSWREVYLERIITLLSSVAVEQKP